MAASLKALLSVLTFTSLMSTSSSSEVRLSSILSCKAKEEVSCHSNKEDVQGGTHSISTTGMRCNLHTQFLQILNLVRLLVCDAKRVEFLLFATLQKTEGTRTVRYVDNKAYRIERDKLDVLVRLGSAGRLGRVKASRASLAQLNGIGEQVKQQAVATSTQRIGQLVHLAL